MNDFTREDLCQISGLLLDAAQKLRDEITLSKLAGTPLPSSREGWNTERAEYLEILRKRIISALEPRDRPINDPRERTGDDKPIPDALYPCAHCAAEYSWPACDLHWSYLERAWICPQCWGTSEAALHLGDPEPLGVSLADEIEACRLRELSDLVKYAELIPGLTIQL